MPVEENTDLQTVLNLIVKEDRKKVVLAIERALESGSDGNYNVTCSIINQNSNFKRILRAKGKALFGDDLIAYRLSGTLQDVTEEFKVQQRRDEFISIASHELKTPMTSVKASIQILNKLIQTQSEKVKVFIDKAQGSIRKMQHLIDDLLNASKIEAGQLILNKSTFNLADLITESCGHIEFLGTHTVTVNGDTAFRLFADYNQLEQVINNFINNAIKYAPNSKTILLTVEKFADAVKVSVKDFGIGIATEKVPHLFKRYYRVDLSGVQYSGLGLGLYICAEIIKRHGGEIGVESETGKESTFWFTVSVAHK